MNSYHVKSHWGIKTGEKHVDENYEVVFANHWHENSAKNLKIKLKHIKTGKSLILKLATLTVDHRISTCI